MYHVKGSSMKNFKRIAALAGRCNFRASGKEEGAEWIEYG